MNDERGDDVQMGVASGWVGVSTSTSSVQRLGGFWVSAGASVGENCPRMKSHEFTNG